MDEIKFILKDHEKSFNCFIHQLGIFSPSWVISHSSKLVFLHLDMIHAN
jgi:hypothetical protein